MKLREGTFFVDSPIAVRCQRESTGGHRSRRPAASDGEIKIYNIYKYFFKPQQQRHCLPAERRAAAHAIIVKQH